MQKTRMTRKDVIMANLEHTSAPRPGITFDKGRVNDMVFASPGSPRGYVQKRWTEGQKEFYDDRFGNVWVRMIDGSIKGEIHTPAIVDWTQLPDFRAPHYDIDQTAQRMQREFARDAAAGRFKTAAIGGWVFDNARYLRKLEVYLLDMAMYPDELATIHRRIADMYRNLILAAAKAGADAIFIGEDMGTQTGLLFSPAMFRDYFKTLYAELMGVAHELGMKVLLHSCGQNREILDDLIDCGVDAFQFDQPAVYDMEDLSGLFKKRKTALWSPIDIQKVLPTGDREYIRSQARLMCATFEGCLIVKNYPDLPGIGVEELWDEWGYADILEFALGV